MFSGMNMLALFTFGARQSPGNLTALGSIHNNNTSQFATARTQLSISTLEFHSRLIHCELEMSYNPRMSMAPPNTQQRNQRKKEEESDAFMRLVSSPRDEA